MEPRKPKILRAIHANSGVRAKYQDALFALIEEMQSSVEYWLSATYKASPPRMAALVAQDASPAKEINKRLRAIAKRWLKRFDEAAPKIAEAYVTRAFKASDSAFRMALKDAGFAIKFNVTPAMRDAFNASLAENVGLIRSIPEEYLLKVGGIVNRAYLAGRDLQTMTKQIRKLYPVTKDRAELIARDQSNKANAVVIRTRQLQLGLTEAIWMHSHGGKVPRPDHVAANGKRYKIAEGCLISGEYIQPGEKINCRCTSRAIIPALGA